MNKDTVLNYTIWKKHYEPFFEILYSQFIEICENNKIHLIMDKDSKEDFYIMLFKCSTGELMNKQIYSGMYNLDALYDTGDEDNNHEHDHEHDHDYYENSYYNQLKENNQLKDNNQLKENNYILTNRF